MSVIKERPILFNGAMVRAILEGRKTVTRRALAAPGQGWEFGLNEPGMSFGTITSPHPKRGKFGVFVRRELSKGSGKYERDVLVCPYGQPGDRLWVRETWAADAQVDAVAPRDLSQGEPIQYPADGAVRQTGCSMITPGKGRTSIHMPRWASRILLEITDVRVERLRDISGAQAKAEGYPLDRQKRTGGSDLDAWLWFRTLWGEINGPDAFTQNPWVWVVEFKRIEQ